MECRGPSRAVACAVLLLLAFGARARADELADARAAMRREDGAAARTALVALVESEQATSRELFEAAYIALQLSDEDVARRVRAIAERREEERAEDQTLGLALGFAYLTLAEHHVRTGTGGSSTALLFADAEARAGEAIGGDDLAAVYLAARARYAQGDLPGALKQLDAVATRPVPPALEAEHAAYLYEYGATATPGPDGRPARAAAEALERAADLLTSSIDPDGELTPARVRRLTLIRAWALHRLGRAGPARAAYLDAHAHGGETARLARRGLASLFAHDAQALVRSLDAAAAQRPRDPAPLDDLIGLHLEQGRHAAALVAVQRRTSAHPRDPESHRLGGAVLARMAQWGEAVGHYTKALELDAEHDASARGLEAVAQALVEVEFDRALETYESLLRLRPGDPYCRNNLGFILRERVSPWTRFEPGGIQVLKPEAPGRIRELLVRCREAYASAVALIPEADDESRDMQTSWNLAGIVNDYGLMLHYFQDIQAAALAERMYLRTLRMTEDAFKDTYSPNLQRLYAYVLKDRELSWYRLARRCKDTILREQAGPDGRIELVPDAQKRAAAERDERRLRARIVQQLERDAADDGAPWPPEVREGNGR